jgi:hypothetical protein
MTVFRGAVDATFGAFGIDAVYTPAGGDPVGVRVIEVASPRPDDQLIVDGKTFIIQGEPERRDPERLVWTLDTRSA